MATHSKRLAALTPESRAELEAKLHAAQNGRCFLSGDQIDLKLHKGQLHIDHIRALGVGGADEDSNFGLAFATYNQSKQALDLQVMRALVRVQKITDSLDERERGVHLGHVLKEQLGTSPAPFNFAIENGEISFTFGGSDTAIRRSPIHMDRLSGTRYVFLVAPLEVLDHDQAINPRPIGSNLRGLIEEFHRGRPQLHVSLGWIKSGSEPSPIQVFDGQHKAAAQILLGARHLPVRVFIDPDLEVLRDANTNAGTKLRQVAFDKATQRHLGSVQLADRMARYRKDRGLPEDSLDFSEVDLVAHFPGERRTMERFVLDAVRNAVIYDPENKLREYIEHSGKSATAPFSYSTIDKTFFSQFIGKAPLNSTFDYLADEGQNARDLETRQLVQLMSLIAEELYIQDFNLEIGASQVEKKVRDNDGTILDLHLRAYRMAREEIVSCWVSYIGLVIRTYFMNTGRPIDDAQLFQQPFDDQLWLNIKNFLKNFAALSLWVNRELSATAFGGKQTPAFWRSVFLTGKSDNGVQVMPSGINVLSLIKPA